jgi:hypothetical protein
MSISGFTKQGISDARTEGGTRLEIKNSIVANNPGAGIAAVAKDNSVTLDNVHSIKNSYGLAVAKTNNASVNRSVFVNNSTAGVEVDSGGQLMLDNSVLSHNTIGITNNGTAGLGNSDITYNGTAFSANASTTFGNNRLFANNLVGTALVPAGGSSPALGQQ